MGADGAEEPRALPLGQLLELGVAGPTGVHWLQGRLQGGEPASGRLVVSWPLEGYRLFPLRPGQRVAVEVSLPGDALYTRETLLESASTEEPPRIVLRPTHAWRRRQRRGAERQAVDVRPTQAERLDSAGGSQPIRAVIRNLSSGGLLTCSQDEVQLDDRLRFTFELAGGGAELRVRVGVRHVERRGELWEAGCQFRAPRASDREQIVEFILAQQRSVS